MHTTGYTFHCECMSLSVYIKQAKILTRFRLWFCFSFLFPISSFLSLFSLHFTKLKVIIKLNLSSREVVYVCVPQIVVYICRFGGQQYTPIIIYIRMRENVTFSLSDTVLCSWLPFELFDIFSTFRFISVAWLLSLLYQRLCISMCVMLLLGNSSFMHVVYNFAWTKFIKMLLTCFLRCFSFQRNKEKKNNANPRKWEKYSHEDRKIARNESTRKANK